MKPLFYGLALILCFSTCKKKVDQKAKDDKAINDYLGNHNLSATKTSDGLYYIISKQGTGAQPSSSSDVKVSYIGYLTDGSVFDASPTTGIRLSLSSTIQGWQEGIPLFKKGGKGTLLIPSALGYGAQAKTNIPANSVLVFDVELLDVY